MAPPNPLAAIANALASFLLVLFAAQATAQPTDIISQGYPGRIEALSQVDVSNEIAAVITKIHFRPGQMVQAGDTLFTLDSTDSELALETQRANLLRVEATLKSAEQDFQRLMKLKMRGSATGVQVLKAEVAQAFADAVRAETRADLKAAQTDLDRTVIRASISGVISPANVNVGTYVKIGRGPLANIVQLDRVRLSYQVPYVAQFEQRDIKNLVLPDGLASRAVLTVKVSDTWDYPRIISPLDISGIVDYASGNITIWAELDNPDGLLRPGMRVTVLSQPTPQTGSEAGSEIKGEIGPATGAETGPETATVEKQY